MTTLESLFSQSKEIEKLINKISDLLRSKGLIDFFVNDRIDNPENPKVVGILAAAESLKSYPIVMYGLREFVDATLETLYPGQNIRSELLPLKEELESRPTDWVSEGDVLVGFSGVTNDTKGPRVVEAITEDGCIWRYLSEPEMEPLPAQYDRFFQRRDWILCELSTESLEGQLEEIEEMQETEIAALQGQYNFLLNKEFLAE
jgi:hypothetical protein